MSDWDALFDSASQRNAAAVKHSAPAPQRVAQERPRPRPEPRERPKPRPAPVSFAEAHTVVIPIVQLDTVVVPSVQLAEPAIAEPVEIARPPADRSDGAAPMRIELLEPAELVAQPVVAGPVATRPPRKADATRTRHRRTSPRLVALTVAAVAACGLAVASVSYATSITTRTVASARAAPSTTPPPAPLPTPSPTASDTAAARDATAWLTANVAHTARLATSRALAGAVRAAGFTHVLAVTGSATRSSVGIAWLLSDRSTTASSLARTLAKSSATVASFGTGTSRIQVHLVLRGSVTSIEHQLLADRSNRQQAGAALADNDGLHESTADRTIIRAGDLDVRASTYLALLANAATVRVTAISRVAAETAASRPARKISIQVTPHSALTTVLAELPRAYRPTVISTHGTVTTLAWNIAIDPIRPVS